MKAERDMREVDVNERIREVNMRNTLVYLSYGQDKFHNEAMFSILSAKFFRRSGTIPDPYTVAVYTDKPELYAWLDVGTVELTPEMLDSWAGSGKFIHRRKIECIIDALERFGGKVAYLDGDTYFRQSPGLLFDRVAPGHGCMHLREQRLTRRPGKAGELLLRIADAEGVKEPTGERFGLGPREAMWNAGVVAVDEGDVGAVRRALTLFDDLWAYEPHVLHEMFALSHCLGEAGLRECADLIFHYWHGRPRAPFLARLPELIAHARHMPLAEAAEWGWRQRPVEPAPWRAAGVVRDTMHRAGIDYRWMRMSF